MWGELALVLAFIIVGGFFAAAEIALVSLRPGQVSRLAETGGRRGRAVERLLVDPNRFLSGVQIGVTLAGFLSSAVGAVTLSAPVSDALEGAGLSEDLSGSIALVGVTIMIAYFSLVVGELAPKRLALQRAEGIALFAASPLETLAKVTRPVIWLLGISSDVVVRLAGGDPRKSRDVMTEAELRDMVAQNEDLTVDERHLIEEVLDAGDRPIREVMVPRVDVSALPASMTLAEAVAAVEGLPHSRYPVVDGGLDDVVGFVHLRDLLAPRAEQDPRTPLGRLARPLLQLPDSRRALPALAEMRRQGAHMAVVVDEYGGGAGVVTLEDLIEELIGDITDEFDPAGSHEDKSDAGTRPLPSEPVDAQLRLEEFAEETGVRLPEGPYDTAAGWLLRELGKIPEVDDTATHTDDRHGEVRFTVTQMRGRRVEQVQLTASQPEPAEPEPSQPG
jgi:putative hemolysin